MVRHGCVVIAAALFVLYAARLAPELNALLREAWAAAEAGNVEVADARRAAFREGHVAARLILQTNLVLLVIAVGVSAAVLRPRRSAPDPVLEPPELLTR